MKPQNRKEVLLDAIANGKVPNITPETRKEAYLKKIAEKAAAGGGGGASSGGNTVIRIDIDSEGSYSANMTYEELCNHYDNKTLCGGVFVQDSLTDLGKYFTPLVKMSDNRGASKPCFYLEFYHTVDNSYFCYYLSDGRMLDYNPNGK